MGRGGEWIGEVKRGENFMGGGVARRKGEFFYGDGVFMRFWEFLEFCRTGDF